MVLWSSTNRFKPFRILSLCDTSRSNWWISRTIERMANYLASIFGTEKDKVNCSFYFKIGACRHGERCSRIHNRPAFSQTVVLQVSLLQFLHMSAHYSTFKSVCFFFRTFTSTPRIQPSQQMELTWRQSRTKRCKNTTTISSKTVFWRPRTNTGRWKRWTCVTTWVTTWWATSTSSFGEKRTQSVLSKTWTTAGSAEGPFMPSSLPSLTSGKRAAASTKWASASARGFATSCTWSPSLESWDGTSTRGGLDLGPGPGRR